MIVCIRKTLVPWLASTATFRPPLNAGSMALGSTSCRQRHGVGKGGERGTRTGWGTYGRGRGDGERTGNRDGRVGRMREGHRRGEEK